MSFKVTVTLENRPDGVEPEGTATASAETSGNTINDAMEVAVAALFGVLHTAQFHPDNIAEIRREWIKEP